jgi:hypothetical protein
MKIKEKQFSNRNTETHRGWARLALVGAGLRPAPTINAGLAPPFSFLLCAFMQNLIASQQNIKNRRK